MKKNLICFWSVLVPLELLKRSEILREVVGHDNWKDTMLRRSDQLLLTPEHGHFEGSMHLKAKTVDTDKVPPKMTSKSQNPQRSHPQNDRLSGLALAP